MKNLYILGVSGSIGMQTLDVVRNNPGVFNIVSVSVNTNIECLKDIIAEFSPSYISVGSIEDCNMLKELYPNIKFGYGSDSLIEAATFNKSEKGVLINAVVGACGLIPTVEAIKISRDIAIANKETLVVAGEIVTSLAKKYNVKLLPIDSEHSAIFQCLNGENKKDVKKLIITASGGSFRDKTRSELKHVTVEDALNHPNWSMGAKITIDSATMLNKGFEVIEAHWLFDIDYDNIETILHKNSVIHSMVEYNDNSVIAHLGTPDMRIPIQYALSYPRRFTHNSKPLDLRLIGSLEFAEMDFKRFPLLLVAYEAGRAGGLAPCIMNASNEIAVNLFLNKKISFLEIEKVVIDALDYFDNLENPTLDEIIECDKSVREYIENKYD